MPSTEPNLFSFSDEDYSDAQNTVPYAINQDLPVKNALKLHASKFDLNVSALARFSSYLYNYYRGTDKNGIVIKMMFEMLNIEQKIGLLALSYDLGKISGNWSDPKATPIELMKRMGKKGQTILNFLAQEVDNDVKTLIASQQFLQGINMNSLFYKNQAKLMARLSFDLNALEQIRVQFNSNDTMPELIEEPAQSRPGLK